MTDGWWVGLFVEGRADRWVDGWWVGLFVEGRADRWVDGWWAGLKNTKKKNYGPRRP